MKNPRCPVHNRAMVVEDHDSAYNQTLWVCREYQNGCRERGHTGPSSDDIYRAEQPGPTMTRTYQTTDPF